MKNISLLFGAFLLTLTVSAQNNYIPSLTPAPGPVAFGLPSSPVAGAHNFQIHGITQFCLEENGQGEDPELPEPEAGDCVGLTSRFSMTNPTTGFDIYDGMLFRMSELNFTFDNQENKNIMFKTGAYSLGLYGADNQAWFGSPLAFPSVDYAYLNVNSTSNGMYIRSNTQGGYGLSLQAASDIDIAMQVYGASNTTKNFVVQGNGFVFARKYTTTLASIPDYVFEPDYKLLTFDELRVYIEENKHLPNIPSADEYEETGVDLGELNRLLLEKVEELTLYTLQLEERLSKLEEEK